jgi:hypothetical protein
MLQIVGSFQCLRPSASLRAAAQATKNYNVDYYSVGCCARSLRSNYVPHLKCGRLYFNTKMSFKILKFPVRPSYFSPSNLLHPIPPPPPRKRVCFADFR